MADRRAVGRAGEEAARKFLADQGYRILFNNFRYGRYGEIDIIAIKSGVVCFVEVKSRASAAYGTPAEAVSYAKRRKIVAVANHFIRVSGYEGHMLRFDVVEVYLNRDGADGAPHTVKGIRHIENAFGV
ncbi:MAG: YraN family protein [Oscillospiraceae bacterium]|nr:YraN family protein [Oscillospiraceae bacterium]